MIPMNEQMVGLAERRASEGKQRVKVRHFGQPGGGQAN